jgi:hypothetical protein
MHFTTVLVNGCLAGALSQVPPPIAETVSMPVCNPQSAIYNPQSARCVAWWAIPSDTGKYTMYRVGGGCPLPCVAQPPLPHEGTWGWDYVGRWLPHNVILGWWHGLCYQGGAGAYQTEGPNLNHGAGTLGSPRDR